MTDLHPEKNRIAKATGVMALATIISRIVGVVRDMVIARVFGAGFATDAFFVAFTIPNLLRRFFAEGSLTAAFVPTFTDVCQNEGADAARRVARICWTLLLLVMAVIALLGVLSSPWVVKLVGYGFADTPGKLALTDLLNRIMFPYIFFISLVALFTGMLNVKGHFLTPSLSPVLLNLAMIAGALVLAPHMSEPIVALGIGVLVGGLVQFLAQIPILYRYGFDLRFNFNFGHPAVTKITRLMLPGVAGVAIYQINVVVTRLLASFLPEGSVSWLYYGQRLFEFPQGVFIVSLAQAVLPTMSRQQTTGDVDGFRDSLSFALKLILLVALPASLGLMLCSKAIYSLLFLRGAFTPYDVEQSALALVWYAPGLLFVGLSRILVPSFYALKDTRTPVVASFWTLLANAGFGLVLMQFMGHKGLALALTLASVLNAFLLMALLSKRLGQFKFTYLPGMFVRLVPGLVGMTAVVHLTLAQMDWMIGGLVVQKAGILLFAVVGGAIAYMVISWWLGVPELRQAWHFLRDRRQKKGS